MTNITAGYDVGGAHLKVARVENGRLQAIQQFPCELWKGLDHLDAALTAASALTIGASRHAITMTGELCELFPSRRDGVKTLTRHLATRLGNTAKFYRGLRGLCDATAAIADTDSVASANFLATAQIVASIRSNVLLIDVGSTTTDIIPCDRPQGLSDAERLQTGELVYSGMTRTPVPSVTTRAVLAGQWQSLARDTFATMADIRRILGELPDDCDPDPTADGRGKSISESLARFGRGFGRDPEERHLQSWQIAAAHVREAQMRSLYDGAIQVLSRPGQQITTVVAAGIGASLADALARRLGLPSIHFGALIDATADCRMHATHYAPAAALALIAAK